MSLAPGTRLGAYEVRSLIGVGGMGEVYLAHDTNLKRNVALKILPESFALEADRLARFKREAHRAGRIVDGRSCLTALGTCTGAHQHEHERLDYLCMLGPG